MESNYEQLHFCETFDITFALKFIQTKNVFVVKGALWFV